MAFNSRKFTFSFIWAEKDPMQCRFWCMYDSCRRTCLKTRNGENGDTVLNSASVMSNSVLEVYVSLTWICLLITRWANRITHYVPFRSLCFKHAARCSRFFLLRGCLYPDQAVTVLNTTSKWNHYSRSDLVWKLVFKDSRICAYCIYFMWFFSGSIDTREFKESETTLWIAGWMKFLDSETSW